VLGVRNSIGDECGKPLMNSFFIWEGLKEKKVRANIASRGMIWGIHFALIQLKKNIVRKRKPYLSMGWEGVPWLQKE